MLQVTNQNMNFNGNSIINDEQIIDMSASSDNSQIWFNFTINNINKYLTNKVAADEDLDEFKATVISAVNKMM